MKKPRIAIDARILSENVTGIGRYTHEILCRLVKNDQFDWFLYSHKPITIGKWKKSNVHLKTYNLSGRFLRMIWAQTILPFLINRDKVDIFWSPSHRIPFLLSNKIIKVVTIHDLIWKHAGYTMRKTSKYLDMALMPYSIKKSDWIFCVSENTKHDILALFPFSKSKISITYNAPLLNGISSNKLLDQKYKILLQDDYYLFVGTHEPRKNLTRLIKAISILSPNVRNKMRCFIIGGKGWGNVNVDNLIHFYNLSGVVKSFGYLPDDVLVQFYKNAKFLVFPSLYEGFGLPIVEAMKFGVPVLTSNLSSMPEIVGDAGILVDPFSFHSIANGISLLIEDSKFRNELSNRAFLRSEFFKWDKTSNQINAIFTDLIKKNSDVKLKSY